MHPRLFRFHEESQLFMRHYTSELRMAKPLAYSGEARQSQNHCTKENTIAAFFGMKF
jgi:hypothetical protein